MNKFPFYFSLLILSIPIIMTYCIIGTHIAFGQNATGQYLLTPLEPVPAGTFTTQTPLPAQQPVVQAAPAQQDNTVSNGLDIAAILALVGTGVNYVKSHFIGKKTNNNESLVKETMAAEVKSKDQIGELARLLFEWNEEKSNALNGTAPEVKLENLKKDKETFTDKTAKA